MNILHAPTYLSDYEINFIFYENIELLSYLALDSCLASALHIKGTPCNAASHKSVPFLGHLAGYAARGFVDLPTLIDTETFTYIEQWCEVNGSLKNEQSSDVCLP